MDNNDKINELQSQICYLTGDRNYYKGKCEVYEAYIEWAKKEKGDE